jgi:hypothetical protein
LAKNDKLDEHIKPNTNQYLLNKIDLSKTNNHHALKEIKNVIPNQEWESLEGHLPTPKMMSNKRYKSKIIKNNNECLNSVNKLNVQNKVLEFFNTYDTILSSDKESMMKEPFIIHQQLEDIKHLHVSVTSKECLKL